MTFHSGLVTAFFWFREMRTTFGRPDCSISKTWSVKPNAHYYDVIMGTIASQITTVYSTVYLDADQRKYQSSASLAFVRGIHRRPVNSPHKWPLTRKMFPFDDVIMVFVGAPQLSTNAAQWCITLNRQSLFQLGKLKWYTNCNVQFPCTPMVIQMVDHLVI